MIIMALDHVRDFIHYAAMGSSPTDLRTTTPVLFLTRWATHICAPAFALTAGMGAFFWWQRGRTRPELSSFLVTRGLWLVVLELTVMQIAYDFNVSLRDPVFLIVLWVLGACMILLAALVWLPVRVLAVLSVATIALHNMLDRVRPSDFGGASWLWNVLHAPGAFRAAGTVVIVAYPLVPWVAVMSLGFVAARVFLIEDAAWRRRVLNAAGIACLAGFVVVRAINLYGDPIPWSHQRNAILTVLSFLNTTKYPPSLAFLVMTLGPAFLLLAAFDRTALGPSNAVVVFGRVPLFYFVAHFFLAHLVAAALALVRYGGAAFGFIFHPFPSMGGPQNLFPRLFGYDLWVAYLVWALIVAALYPVCRWFAEVKASRRSWWVSYV